MFEHVARELRAKLMRERPVGHQAGHLASRAGRRPPAQTAARPNKRHHMAPGTPMDAETQRPEHRRTSRTPAAPQQHVVSYNPWPQPTKTPTFPHQQAEKSLQNQHVLSILQVGSHQLQYRFFRTNKPKSRHKTNTFCPLTPKTGATTAQQDPGTTKTADPEGSAVSSCARGELNPHSITGTRT